MDVGIERYGMDVREKILIAAEISKSWVFPIKVVKGKLKPVFILDCDSEFFCDIVVGYDWLEKNLNEKEMAELMALRLTGEIIA